MNVADQVRVNGVPGSHRCVHRVKALPSTINTYISVLKNTALLTAIGYPELTSVARSIAAVTFRDFEMITVLAVVYLTIVWTFSILMRMLEARLALPKEA